MADVAVTEPFPIFFSGGRYLLYDIDTITYVRREHHICGVLIGTIPHISQQNVFLGTPLELMPEEARILAEKGHAYVVDDVESHAAILMLSPAERNAFSRMLEKQGKEASQNSQKRSDNKKEEWKRKVAKRKAAGNRSAESAAEPERSGTAMDQDADTTLFASSAAISTKASSRAAAEKFFVTPSTSHPPLATPAEESALPLPTVPQSYPLFAYLFSKGFFMSPGLRFGCHYCVYPGDPLRFHSHFLAVGKKWDEEFQLLDVVGGGRLGTAVKKAYLLGGAEEPVAGAQEHSARVFCVEWAGM
jgi:tRNA-splicing endonuclease subunit Sen34